MAKQMERAGNPRSANRMGKYYTPPTDILEVPGIQHRPINTISDLYVGTAEALASAGLLPLEKFPGHDGLHSTAVSYRPLGVDLASEISWHRLPGFMNVQRRVDGTYRLTLNVSAEERARRVEVEKERKARRGEVEAERKERAEAEAEIIRRQLRPEVRSAAEAMIKFFGGIWAAKEAAQDNAFMRNFFGHDSDVAAHVSDALAVLSLADDVRRRNADGLEALHQAVPHLSAGVGIGSSAPQRPTLTPRRSHLRLVWSAGASLS